MDARFIINDGQHRRAAIEALDQRPELGHGPLRSFFLDIGLERCQPDVCRPQPHAIRPSRSLVCCTTTATTKHSWQTVVMKSDVFRRHHRHGRNRSPNGRKLFHAFSLSQCLCRPRGRYGDRQYQRRCLSPGITGKRFQRTFPPGRRCAKTDLQPVRSAGATFVRTRNCLQALGKAGNALLNYIPKIGKTSERDRTDRLVTQQRQDLGGRALIGGKVSRLRPT